MKTIDSKTYAIEVEDRIVDAIESRLYQTYNEIVREFGFNPVVGELAENRFAHMFRDGYASEMRDLAIAFYEEVGMPIESDGKDW